MTIENERLHSVDGVNVTTTPEIDVWLAELNESVMDAIAALKAASREQPETPNKLSDYFVEQISDAVTTLCGLSDDIESIIEGDDESTD